MNYSYGAKIKVTLSIGYSGAEQEGVICPKIDSSYDEEEWNALSEEEREDWVSGMADDWSRDYITLEYAVVKP